MIRSGTRVRNSRGVPLVADEPLYRVPLMGQHKCRRCRYGDRESNEFHGVCRERVEIGLWVMCEIPNELDMIRARKVTMCPWDWRDGD